MRTEIEGLRTEIRSLSARHEEDQVSVMQTVLEQQRVIDKLRQDIAEKDANINA